MATLYWKRWAIVSAVAVLWSGFAVSGCIPEDEVCPKGFVKDASGSCVVGCNTTDDCPGDKICQQVTCIAAPCYGQCSNPSCKTHEDCGTGGYCDADTGTCKKLGYCDYSKDCYGQPLVTILCIGEFTCQSHQCKFQCGTATCDPIKDGQFGFCDMVMGYGWNGKTCATVSGCGCDVKTDPSCARVYKTLDECQKATSSCGLKWYSTCGYPVCGPDPAPTDVPKCLNGEKEGDPCSYEGQKCNAGLGCGAYLICASSDPKAQGCPISQKRFKTEIRYVTSSGLDQLYRDALGIKLATYHYKGTSSDQPKKLGFIIDDLKTNVPVNSKRERVDLYGYTSMAVAGLQVQARQLELLRKQIDELKREIARLRTEPLTCSQ